MATIIDWQIHGPIHKAVHGPVHLAVRREDGAYTWRAFLGASRRLKTSRASSPNAAKLEAERFARSYVDEQKAKAELAKQASPESTPKATTRPARFERKQAVVLRKGRKHVRQLLAIVADFSVVPEGLPGPHRYRYMLKPARIQDGVPVAIECFAWVRGVKGDQLEAYDEATHGGNLAKWRVL